MAKKIASLGESKGKKVKAVKKTPVLAKPKAKSAAKKTEKVVKKTVSKPAAKTVKAVKPAVKKPAVKAKATVQPKKAVKKEAPKKATASKACVKKACAKKTCAKKVGTKKTAAKKQAPTRGASTPKKKVIVSIKAKAPAKSTKTVATKKVATKTVVSAVKTKAPAKTSARKSASVVLASSQATKPAGKVKLSYNPGDFVVYPTHGVGKISEIATKKVAGQDLELVVVHFDKSRMTLRVPVEKARTTLRKISDRSILQGALTVLQQKPKVKKAMWSRRQQEYETKINSGDPKLLAEVIRDLHKRHQMADQSYTERQIYETAFERLAHELAASDKTDPTNASDKIRKLLGQPV